MAASIPTIEALMWIIVMMGAGLVIGFVFGSHSD